MNPRFDEFRLDAALVGRDAELALLRQKMSATSAGTGSIVLISGEEGSGKSRIGAEVACLAEKSGMLFLGGSGVAEHTSAAYSSLLDALTDFVQEASESEVESLRLAASQLAPDLCERLFPGAQRKAVVDADEPELRQRLFTLRVKSLLFGLAQSHPLVLFLDDLHAADSSSLHLLRLLTLNLQSVPLLILATFRPLRPASNCEPPARHMSEFVLHLCSQSHVELLQLGRLPLRDTRAFAHSRFAPCEFDEHLIAQLHEKSAGWPLLLGQCLEYLRDQGIIFQQRGIWRNRRVEELQAPDSLRELVRRRAQALPENTRTLLSAASVQGQHFDGITLAESMARSPLEVLRHLSRIDRTIGLIEPMGRGFRFSHGILTEVFYSLLSKAKRNRTHSRIAEIMSKKAPREVESLAFHFLRSDNPTRSLPYLTVASRRARSACAYEEGRRLLEAAVEICQQISTPEASSQRVEFLLELAEIDERLGEWARSAQRCREVLRESDPSGHDLAVGKALTQLASLSLRKGEALDALQLNREALSAVESGNEPAVVADVYLRMGMAEVALSRFDEARKHFAEARRRAPRDTRLLALIRQQFGQLASLDGDHLEATLCHMRVISFYRESNDCYARCRSYAHLGASQEAQDLWDKALHCYAASADLARQIGAVDLLAFAQVRQARAHVAAGDLGKAETACQAARSSMEAMGYATGLVQCEIVEAAISRQRGQYDRAEEHLLQARYSLMYQKDRLALAICERELGMLNLDRGNPNAARDHLRDSANLFRDIGVTGQVEKTEEIISSVTTSTD